MKIDSFGQCFYSSDDLVNILYKNPDQQFNNFLVSDPTEFNKAIKSLHLDYNFLNEYESKTIPLDNFDKKNQDNWYMPDSYKNLDIDIFVQNLCNTSQELARVKTELILYKKLGLYKLLQFLIYLVDIMRENKIVWGVGRGSSVASYVLYLIGIHKINSLKYNLDINEFLR
jgi:DNA polymerase III alpha subunit